MQYNHLGKSGLKLSELSYGSWLTLDDKTDTREIEGCIQTAYDSGINFFDTAEAYGHGKAETLLGKALKKFRREEIVVSTKLFWGGKEINQTGLSRKHLIEGIKNSLKRLDMEYVDLIFCHRPDPETPIEETVLAMDSIIRAGLAFYWGTSQWSKQELEHAYEFAYEYKCIPPSMEQTEYSLLSRWKIEEEFISLYKKYGLGTTIWSPLASGVLTGKYNKEIPKGSRLEKVKWLKDEFEKSNLLGKEVINKVSELSVLAKELGCTTAQLAIAWCLKNPNVSTVIIGASNIKQLKENLKAAEIKKIITPDVLEKINKIFCDTKSVGPLS